MTVQQKKSSPHLALPFPVLLGGLAVALLTFVLVAEAANADATRLPLHTRFLGTDVSRMAVDAALARLDTAQSNLEDTGVRFLYQGRALTLPVGLTSPQDLDISVNYVSYDREATAARLARLGRSGNSAADWWTRFAAFYVGATVKPAVDLNGERFGAALGDLLGSYEDPAKNAHFTYAKGSFSITSEAAGTVFDRAAIRAVVLDRMEKIDATPIALAVVPDAPTVRAADLMRVREDAQAAIDRGPVTIELDDQRWTFDADALAAWLTVVNPARTLTLDPKTVGTSLEPVAAAAHREVKEPRFTISTTGRVTEFQPAGPGRELDLDATLALLETAVLRSDQRTIAAATRVVNPQGTTGNSNTLGITELVAEGRTNFSGSPANRRFNIGVGARSLNGVIIKPGETFSLVKALVPIDAKSGYRQELVIKGNRTIPEFGGGLCQIGTTTFRLVMNAGLPILERRNHSYRVRYYEPPVGKDATIYDPKPDFRFTNDYANPLLLTTAIEGDDLVFRFYGTKEAREIVQTTPKLFNIVAPPPKKTIETTDIPVGTTKCLEHAHPGSDAEFTYSVTYLDGTVKSEVFKSHYRPWQEVCLKGVKSLPKSDTSVVGTNANTNSGAGTSANTNAPPVTGTNPADSLPN